MVHEHVNAAGFPATSLLDAVCGLIGIEWKGLLDFLYLELLVDVAIVVAGVDSVLNCYLEKNCDGLAGTACPRRGKSSRLLGKSEMPKTIYQFKVSLSGIKPEIWRRIQVPEEYTFWGLHVAIQDAMGWLDYHLHAFHASDEVIAEVEIGIPDPDGFDEREVLPGWEVPLPAFFMDVGQEMLYVYDFGDDWAHKILFEGILLGDKKKYPRLLDGKRACPPEDCGGIYGYKDLVKAMKDKKHEEHERFVEWLGRVYEPANFKKSEVTFDDPRERFKIAFEDML